MKTLKRILAIMMTALMLFSTVSVGMTSVAASKKVKKIKLNKTSVTLYVGETYKLKATVSPSNASNKKVTWSSSNKKVATVSSSGKLTAKKAGKVTITVKAKDGSGKKATVKVTVKKPTKVSKIKLSKTSVKLTEGNTTTIKATVSPSKATNKKVSWSSSKTSVATVSSSGKITAKKAGTATITCKAKDGSGKKATVKVTVNKKKTVKVTSVDLDRNSMSLTPGKTYTLSYDISPSNATNKDVTWKSSDTSVATVSSSGKVTAVAVGSAVITATAKDGSGEKDTCRVTVKPVLVSGISLSKTYHEGDIGSTFRLTANVSPSNATNKKISWYSSDNSVATVDAYGNVRLVNSGEATIIAEAKDDSGEAATCQIKVKDVPVSQIVFDRTKYPLTDNDKNIVGETFTITATVYPANATNKNLIWASSNPSVANVYAGGTVVLLSTGTATITATAADGSGATAVCVVTVGTADVTGITLSKTEITATPGRTGDVLTATVSPSYASNKNVVWSSENENIVRIDQSGALTYVGLGETYIRATAADGKGASAVCKVKVVEAVYVTAIILNKTSITGMSGTTHQLSATISPAEATDKSVTWKSSNTAVATVDASGVVRLAGGGTAVITATAVDGSGVTATCNITTQVKATDVGVYLTTNSWYNGKSGQAQAYVNPTYASQAVTWSVSSDDKDYPANEYVTIDSSGNIKVIKEPRKKLGIIDIGHKDLTITVTATAKDGSGKKGSASFVIKEKINVTGVAFSKTNYSTYVGQELTASVTVSPADASETDVRYVSDNSDVIKVENGKLIAVGKGNAKVTAILVDNSSITASADFTVSEPHLFIVSKMGETYEPGYVGEKMTLQAIWTPPEVIYDLGMKIVVEDESILRHVSTEKAGTANNSSYLTFELLKEGETTITITTTDGKLRSEPFKIEVKGIMEDDYHDGLIKGDKVIITPEVGINENRVFASPDMQCSVPAEYAEYLSVNKLETGRYEVEILKDLPAKGAYVTVVPYPAEKADFNKNIYFVAGKYQVVTEAQALQAMKNYTQSASSATGTRQKDISYGNINVIKAEVKLSSDDWITNAMIQASMKDMTEEELGASDMVYYVFGESEKLVDKSVARPVVPISINEADIAGVQVIDNGGVTYQLVLTLKNQANMGIASVNSSAYAKTMPVIGQTQVSAFKTRFTEYMNAGASGYGMEEINEGTVEQAYREGKVVLTINKITDKIEKCDYYFVSDVKMTNANLDVSVTLDKFGKFNMNTIATFTVSVEEKISVSDIKY
ncbi:MAG: Ig-like domain-containing protein [Clostridia bacterium]|nr:Ig-like domain-containing protein [Clostridia bacterium]